MPSEQLLWAVENGDLQCIKELIKEVPNVNSAIKKNGRTLIHYAADYGQKEICDFLIKNGADVNIIDNFGVTPLLAAVYEGHGECVSLLLENGAKIGVAPDGTAYADCATSEDVRNILQNHV